MRHQKHGLAQGGNYLTVILAVLEPGLRCIATKDLAALVPHHQHGWALATCSHHMRLLLCTASN